MEQAATAGTAARTTLPRLLRDLAASTPDTVAYRHRVRARGREAWEDITWAQAHALVEPLAAGLVALGVEPGDRVAILSRTRVEWVLGHLAVLATGATTVAIHPGSPPGEVARLVAGAGAVVVLAEDRDQAEKLRRVRGDIRTVRRVVLVDGTYPDRRVTTLEALLSSGEQVLARDATAVRRRVDALRPDALATVLHPPGADPTGDGVGRTHGDWAAAAGAARARARTVAGTPAALRRLRTPLTGPAGHALLVAQLGCGRGTVVDGPALEPAEGVVADPPR